MTLDAPPNRPLASSNRLLPFLGIDGLPIPSGGSKAVEASKTRMLPTQLVTQANAPEVYAKGNG